MIEELIELTSAFAKSIPSVGEAGLANETEAGCDRPRGCQTCSKSLQSAIHTLIVNVIVDWACSWKVDVPKSVIFVNQTTLFEWYVVRCDFKNECQTNM